MYKKRDTYIVEKHPFEISIPKDATTLILGTFPSNEKNRQFEYYYSSKDNLFWKILSKVFDKKFNELIDERTKKEKENFLHSKKIGVTDIIQMCYRKNDLSNDGSIYPVKLLDLFDVLNDYPKINKIILTSRTEVIGVYGLVKTYFLQNDLEPFDIVTSKFNKYVKEGSFSYKDKKIKVLVPYSPSNTAKEQNNISVNEYIKMYKYCLIE